MLGLTASLATMPRRLESHRGSHRHPSALLGVRRGSRQGGPAGSRDISLPAAGDCRSLLRILGHLVRAPVPLPYRVVRFLELPLLLAAAVLWLAVPTWAQTPGAPSSRVVEAAGRVEFLSAATNTWRTATNGLALVPGDRLRTGPQSRAAVQFSDRSVIRLGEATVLEIQPPRQAGSRRFSLREGLLFFFNRERPADVEFETPVSAGAIRGTEFVIEAAATGATLLTVFEGRVELTSAGATLGLESGEQAEVLPGAPPRRTALLTGERIVQWALYYPAVLHPADLGLTPEEAIASAAALGAYRDGDVLAAHAAMTRVASGGPGTRMLRAALALAVGDVASADAQLATADSRAPVARALRELLQTVRGGPTIPSPDADPQTASEWLARSYTLQADFRLEAARHAARQAVLQAPDLGIAHARVAELEWALDRPRPALEGLDKALRLSPRLAFAHALRGFILLDQREARAALAAFDGALALDAALGTAWLGRGLAQLQLRRRDEALASLQTAAALEPRRALHRSYLGKAWSQAGEPRLADKEFRRARELDPQDPTAWLYEAIHQWWQNRPNPAVRDLERSVALNDNRRLFRSRLLLDRDRAVRSANLAALYREAGLPEVSLRSAARAVSEDYANFSTHLFLAHSYQALEDRNRFDLRYETTRQSELLLANLLAPAGAANLSQLLSQQEHLQFFDPRPIAVSSATEYRSDGDWQQRGSVFGALDGFSYALDTAYDSRHGTEGNDDRERLDLSLQVKQRVSWQDEFYLQAGFSEGEAGDVARHYSPADLDPDLRVTERQAPNLHAGWHHAWSPASHTLFLFSRLMDDLTLADREHPVLFLRQIGGEVRRVSTDAPGFNLDYESKLTLYSAELQQLWQSARHALVIGGRFQAGEVQTAAVLDRALTGPVTDQSLTESLQRGGLYAYEHWHVAEPLRLVAGISYDRLTYPRNSEIAPLTEGDATRDLLAPKVGFLLEPWARGLFRGAYTRSLGGVFFDPSVRLEPTQVAGFNQAFRSLLPESVAGLVPGTLFDTFQLGMDQSFASGTYLGIEAGLLRSDGAREVGALTNSGIAPVPDTPTATGQDLEYEEGGLAAYAAQLLGEGFSLGARYRLSRATLETRFPALPDTALGLEEVEQDEAAMLHHLVLSLGYQHPSGFFAQAETDWYSQSNTGYNPDRPGDDFWQQHLWLGWRFPRRHAELRLGVLNLTDTDYRLNPLNLYREPPRHRTLAVDLRLNF